MTAVKWLVEKLNSKYGNDDFIITHINEIEQAKQMEKDNTISFGYRCIGEVDSELGDLVYKKVPEEVYNETYGNARPELRYKDGTPIRSYNSPKLQAIEMENNKSVTAVEWLEKELKNRYPLINSEPLFEQAKQMECKEYKKIYDHAFNYGSEFSQTEISDEEIEKIAKEYVLYNESKRNWVVEGMKLYREQIKNK